jgi:hypothetical protein
VAALWAVAGGAMKLIRMNGAASEKSFLEEFIHPPRFQLMEGFRGFSRTTPSLQSSRMNELWPCRSQKASRHGHAAFPRRASSLTAAGH